MSDDPDRRPVDDLAEQLDRIEQAVTEARDVGIEARDIATEALAEARATNGRLRGVEEDLYGPEEERRARHNAGLLGKFNEVRRLVFDVAQSRDESQSVREAKRWIIGTSIAIGTLMIGVLGVLVTIVRSL